MRPTTLLALVLCMPTCACVHVHMRPHIGEASSGSCLLCYAFACDRLHLPLQVLGQLQLCQQLLLCFLPCHKQWHMTRGRFSSWVCRWVVQLHG